MDTTVPSSAANLKVIEKLVEMVEPPVGTSDEPELSTPKSPPLSKMEFVVPLPLKGIATDTYRGIINIEQDLVKEFTSNDWSADSPIIAAAEKLIRKLRDITTHIDLIQEETMTQISQDQQPPERIHWDKSVSSKFEFLSRFLDLLRDVNLHVVLLAGEGLYAITQTFLVGKGVKFQLPSGEFTPASQPGSLSVTLLPSSSSKSQPVTKQASVIVCLDERADLQQPRIRALREDFLDPEKLAPVLLLVVVNSPQHVDLCVPQDVDHVARLRAIIGCAALHRHNIGRSYEHLSPDDAAMAISQYLLTLADEHASWPLPPISTMDDIETFISTQSQDTVESQSSVTSAMTTGAKDLAGTRKRPLVGFTTYHSTYIH